MHRVLLTFAVPDGAGAMRMMVHFGLALRAAGYEVVLAHGDSTAHSGDLPPAARKLLNRLEQEGVRCIPLSGFRERYSHRLNERLAQLVRRHETDALVCFHPLDMKHALRVAGRTGTKCVVCMQNRQVFWGSPLLRRLKAYVFRRLIRRNATAVICTSDVVRDDMTSLYGARPEQCCVIPNGIPIVDSAPDDAVREDARRRLEIADHQTLLVQTGRLDVQKGQDVLLNALAGVSSDRWVLLLVGAAPEGTSSSATREYVGRLKAMVEKNRWQRRVRFLGWRDDVDEILAASDIYVHAARWEGPAAPLAVMEAMAAARPVITSDCSGRPDRFVDGTHGYVVPAEDPAALATALNTMLALSRRERTKMGSECRLLAERSYEIGRIRSRYVEQISEVLSGTDRSSPPVRADAEAPSDAGR